jgi:hypothetical protein
MLFFLMAVMFNFHFENRINPTMIITIYIIDG